MAVGAQKGYGVAFIIFPKQKCGIKCKNNGSTDLSLMKQRKGVQNVLGVMGDEAVGIGVSGNCITGEIQRGHPFFPPKNGKKHITEAPDKAAPREKTLGLFLFER